jgi:hypothetical protein
MHYMNCNGKHPVYVNYVNSYNILATKSYLLENTEIIIDEDNR